MRKIFLVLTLLAQFKLHAQESADSLKLQLTEVNPDSSAIGKPIGDSVVITIGPDGGKIRSADGMMELTFPPGALAAPTAIGIQQVESTSIMSFGNAYACSPDGIHFQKPVQLVIHYTDSMAKGVPASAQIIEWQDKSGRWSAIERVKIDTSEHSISSDIEHFSTLTPANRFPVTPKNSTLKVTRRRIFVLSIRGTYPDGKHYTSANEADTKFWPGKVVAWTVNGKSPGDDYIGRIEPLSMDQMNVAIYTAPVTVPLFGPIEIQAAYAGQLDSTGAASMANSIKSGATVDIYDEFHYNFTGYDQVGHLHMIDSATCDITIYSSGKVILSNIRNPPPWSDWPPQVAKCRYIYPDKAGWKGMVQIAGLSKGQIKLASGRQRAASLTPFIPHPPVTHIYADLVPTFGSSPAYYEHCPGFDKQVYQMPVPASPTQIHFSFIDGSSDITIYYLSAMGTNKIEAIKGNEGFSTSIYRK